MRSDWNSSQSLFRRASPTGQDSLVIPPDCPLTACKLGVKLGVFPREGVTIYQAKDTSKGNYRQVILSKAAWGVCYKMLPLGKMLFILPLTD